MLASIDNLRNIAAYWRMIFLVLAIVGLPVPTGMFLCLIIVVVASS